MANLDWLAVLFIAIVTFVVLCILLQPWRKGIRLFDTRESIKALEDRNMELIDKNKKLDKSVKKLARDIRELKAEI